MKTQDRQSPMNGNNPLGRAVQPTETFGKKAPEIARVVERAIRNEPPVSEAKDGTAK